MSWHQKICPISLRWIINYRIAIKNENLLGLIEKDNHNRGTFLWTKNQSLIIDRDGWDKWLMTINSQGHTKALYSHFYNKTNR